MAGRIAYGIGTLVVLIPFLLLTFRTMIPFILKWSATSTTRAVITFFSLIWLAALAVLLFVSVREPLIVSLPIALPGHLPGDLLTLRVDRVSASMLLLVVTVSGVVHLWSLRAMREERYFRRYFSLLSLVTLEVLGVILADNLLLLGFFWILKGITLTFLLAHYHHRPASRRSALIKLRIDAIGDLALIQALVLTWQIFHTFSLSTISLQLLQGTHSMEGSQGTLLTLLLLVAAMAKSAQFPLHSWLPGSVEAPTPVSALMHAGLINAGGFLLIRLSFLLAATPITLILAVIVGSLTALYGTLIMLTRNDVKGMLVYSTMGQMGFMILECGLGAFSLALFHIMVHGLFKAHAFLSSGSVIQQKIRNQRLAPPPPHTHRLVLPVLLGGAFLLLSVLFAPPLLRGELLHPGSLLLLFAWITIAHAFFHMPQWPTKPEKRLLFSLGSLLIITLLYGIVIQEIEAFYAPDVAPMTSLNQIPILVLSIALLLLGLGSLLLSWFSKPAWLNRLLSWLYVRALFSGYRR